MANVTFIGGDGELLAFDTGPGNALLDDWMKRTTGEPFDKSGALAATGKPDAGIIARFAALPFFDRPPPKSLDRDAFASIDVTHLSAADGAATLAELTVSAIVAGVRWLPSPPRRWLVAGGGRHNALLMQRLNQLLAAPVEPVEAIGHDGDTLEAAAWAYLAVRSRLGLPITFPGTTGVARPFTGGVFSPA